MPTTPCPDCIVILPVGLRYYDLNGDLVTQLPLDDYLQLVGNHIVTLIDEVDTLTSAVDDLTQRVTTIENNLPTYVPVPEISMPGIMPDSELYPLEDVLTQLALQFIDLRNATGTPTALSNSITYQGGTLKDEQQLSDVGLMKELSGWVEEPTTVADSITNMWLTILDMRAAMVSCLIPTGSITCDDVVIGFTAVVNPTGNYVTLNFLTSDIPAGFYDQNPLGSILNVTDAAGHSWFTRVNVSQLASSVTGVQINLANTSINANLDLQFDLTTVVTNGQINCTKYTTVTTATSVNACTSVTFVPAQTSIAWSFNPVVTENIVYSISISDGTVDIAQRNYTNPSSVVSDSITGLTADTAYIFVLRYTLTGESSTLCSTYTVTTLPAV
jgi:hypothetical protein